MSLKQNDKKIKAFGVGLGILAVLAFWQVWLIEYKYNAVFGREAVQIVSDERVTNLFRLNTESQMEASSSLGSISRPKNFYIAASKSGTKYYYQNCGGLNRIKPENLVFFESESEAEGKGLELAKGCLKP